MSKTHKVTLRPDGAVVEVPEGKNLLEALRACDVYVKSSCGGHATCSDCIIKVVSGEDHLSPPPFSELKLLGNVFHITKERLACQTMLEGDVTIDISKHDKARDEAKLKNKTSAFSKKKQTLVRKEADRIKNNPPIDETEIPVKKDENWKKHWEKEKSDAPKKLAGGKRPKFFDTDKVDYEKDTYTRPLSAEKQKLKDERLMREKDLKNDNQLVKESKEIPKSDKDFKKFRS